MSEHDGDYINRIELKRIVSDFESKVCKDSIDLCWTWLGDFDGEHPVYTIGTKKWKVIKLAYLLYYWQVPIKRSVSHACGNEDCINPTHLIFAAQAPEPNRVKRKYTRRNAS